MERIKSSTRTHGRRYGRAKQALNELARFTQAYGPKFPRISSFVIRDLSSASGGAGGADVRRHAQRPGACAAAGPGNHEIPPERVCFMTSSGATLTSNRT